MSPQLVLSWGSNVGKSQSGKSFKWCLWIMDWGSSNPILLRKKLMGSKSLTNKHRNSINQSTAI
jgi:hypothetical protein